MLLKDLHVISTPIKEHLASKNYFIFSFRTKSLIYIVDLGPSTKPNLIVDVMVGPKDSISREFAVCKLYGDSTTTAFHNNTYYYRRNYAYDYNSKSLYSLEGLFEINKYYSNGTREKLIEHKRGDCRNVAFDMTRQTLYINFFDDVVRTLHLDEPKKKLRVLFRKSVIQLALHQKRRLLFFISGTLHK